MRLTALLLVFLTIAENGFSQTSENSQDQTTEIILLAGLLQPLMLQGGNFEVDVYTPKVVFNYSHGFSLDLDREHGTTVGKIKSQNLAVHLPYSTGFGIGYRVKRYFDVRLEPKLHRFNVYYDGSDRSLVSNEIAAYNTVTMGVGAYFRWKPFEKKQNALKGVFTSTSLRYWQNIWSSLDNNQIVYENRCTNQTETHKAANIGIANTPFLFNIAVGYSIGHLNRKKNRI